MTPEQIRGAYIFYIEDYCNQFFDEDNLPAGVLLALDILLSLDPLKFGVASETVGDLSITYKEGSDDPMPGGVRSLLAPYVRPHLVSDKTKREYKRG